MNSFLFQISGQVNDINGTEGTLFNAHAATNTKFFRNDGQWALPV